MILPHKEYQIEQGKRVKKLRSMYGLTRKQLAQELGVSYTTLQNWEEGSSSGLSEKGAIRLVEFLNKKNIDCSVQWLLDGLGNLPSFVEDTKNSDILNVDKRIMEEISFFEQHNPFATTYQITDNSMEPLYCFSDIVGGIKVFDKDIVALSGKNCIIETNSGIKTCKFLEYDYDKKNFDLININLTSGSKLIYKKEIDILSAALVIWIRKIRI